LQGSGREAEKAIKLDRQRENMSDDQEGEPMAHAYDWTSGVVEGTLKSCRISAALH
jgi:hypothetical protein